MAVIEIGLAIADLGIARMWPCSTLIAPSTYCAATPTSKYRRFCGVDSHTREIWICPVHAALVAAGGTICKNCAARGGITGIVRIERLTAPIRIP